MKKILLLGTGGTIASVRTDDGLTPAITAAQLLEYVPEYKLLCAVDAKDVCNIDSTNVSAEVWLKLVSEIRDNYSEYDGFVICHGTDTLSYTAAALSYLVQNSRKPIVLTGAQRPINVENTDAAENLYDSLLYTCDSAAQGVSIVFGGKAICGTRAKKVRARSFNAFESVNFPYPATIADGRIIRYFKDEPYDKPISFCDKLSGSVFLLKLIPGISPDILPYLFERYDCIVFESFGVGGMPTEIAEMFYKEMARWRKAGKFGVMATQVYHEGSNMTVYEVGRRVKKDFNMLEAYDMTLESTIAKLMWILGSKPSSEEEIKDKFYTTINHDILHKAQ